MRITFNTLLASLVLAFAFSCTSKESARINCEIEGSGGEIVKIEYQKATGIKVLDTLQIRRSGSFKYKFDLKEQGFYRLSVPGEFSLPLLINVGDNINVTGDISDFRSTKTISGSKESVLLNELYDSLFSTKNMLNELNEKYKEINDVALQQLLNEEYKKILADFRKYSIGIILENPSSFVSYTALFQKFNPNLFVFYDALDLQFYKIVSDSLSKNHPKSMYTRMLQANYDRMYKSYQANRILNSVDVVETGLPDISLPDFSGKERLLSDLKGNHVLLLFWASWDRGSVQILNGYKRVFDRFKNKGFKVYCVSYDKQFAVWHSAVRYEEIEEWINVCDTAYPNTKSLASYNVSQLPTSYFISPDQTEILGKNMTPEQLSRRLTIIKD